MAKAFSAQFFLLLLLPALFAAPGFVDTVLPASLSVPVITSLELTSFSASPPSATSGDDVLFSATFQNIGNTVTDFNASVYIYDSGGSLVEIVNYTTSTIAGGEVQTLNKLWSTAGKPTGAYSAFANASYNGTYSGTLNASFVIVAQPSPPGGGGGGIIYTPEPNVAIPIYPQLPEVSIPSQPPVVQQLRVLSLSPYREVLRGESTILNPLIENPTGSAVQLSISLGGAGSLLSTPLQNALLGPNEKRTFPVSVQIPMDMPPGYYSLSVNISSNHSSVSYPLILRVVPFYKIGQPEVKRQLSLDYEKGETLVTLSVTNPSGNPVEHLQVFEQLPDFVVLPSGKVIYITQPNKVTIGADGTVENMRFDLENLNPYETRNVFYRIPLLLNDMTYYRGWKLAQTVDIQTATNGDILLRDIQAPSLMAGEKGEIMVKLFNSGSLNRDVEVDMLGPAGWRITPRSLTFTLPSRNTETLAFMAEAPAFADPGTYGFNMRVKHDEQIFDKDIYAYVYKPVTEIFAPPLESQFSAWLSGNLPPVLFFLGSLALIGAAALLIFRSWNSPKYSESRLEDMRNLERMLEGNEKKKGR